MRLSSKRGYAAVFMCIMLPALISILGICIDGGLLMYYDSRLMSATKFAAFSATAFYEVADGSVRLKGNDSSGPSYDAANRALSENFSEAWLSCFTISSLKPNECTVEAKVKVNFVFSKIFHVDSKILKETFTAERNAT